MPNRAQSTAGIRLQVHLNEVPGKVPICCGVDLGLRLPVPVPRCGRVVDPAGCVRGPPVAGGIVPPG